MRRTRRYIQFNDLVFDNYDMIVQSDGGVNFKTNTTEYSFGHGSYSPNKADYLFAKEQQVSITLRFSMKKLPCDQQDFYRSYAITEISKPGKLWAIQEKELLWAYAKVDGWKENEDSRDNILEVDVDFIIPEGVWHKADPHKAFLQPYDVCTMFDCLPFEQPKECIDPSDCCTACENSSEPRNDCTCCCDEEITKDMALCRNYDLLLSSYGACTPSFKVIYDCDKGEQFFGMSGERICTDSNCTGFLAGSVYSNTDIPTRAVTVSLVGELHNPEVVINGNTNIVKGDYNGTLTITPSGDIYYQDEDSCCESLLDISVWSIPSNMEYGWTIHHGYNKVGIHTNTCCKTCAYIQIDALTV